MISGPVNKSFKQKDVSVRHANIKAKRMKGYFAHDINGIGNSMYTSDDTLDDICKTIEFLIDNLFIWFWGDVFPVGLLLFLWE